MSLRCPNNEDLAAVKDGQDKRTYSKIVCLRAKEANRRDRFLNPKLRTIGIDKEALDAQVAEKEARKKAEREQALAEQQESEEMDRYRNDLHAKQANSRRMGEAERKLFSLSNLLKSHRREFWLSDPAQLKKECPIFTGEGPQADPGPSAAQSFAGEKREPKELMQAKLRRELELQLEAKQQTQRLETEAEQAYGKVRAVDQVEAWTQADQEKARLKKEELMATRLFNEAQSRQKAERSLREQKAGEEAATKDVTYMLEHSKLLSEAEFLVGPNGRVVRDSYRRMSTDQVQAILDQRALQVEALREKEKQELLAERTHADHMAFQRQHMLDIYAEKERLARDHRARARLNIAFASVWKFSKGFIRVRTMEDNKRLAAAQKERQGKDNELYSTNEAMYLDAPLE